MVPIDNEVGEDGAPGSSTGHRPVLRTEVVSFLITNPAGVYIDLTVGGGGHLLALSQHLDSSAMLLGIDRDPAAIARAGRSLGNVRQNIRLATGSFGDMDDLAKTMDVTRADGILLDLGLSSYQLDEPSRGFAFRLAGPLDMRFDTRKDKTAAEILKTYSERDIAELLFTYGEERQARRIAKSIVTSRRTKEIKTTEDLVALVSSIAKPPHTQKALARVFQALRIAVNNELSEIERCLPKTVQMLTKRGRLAVITYHSLEDRLVKRFIQNETSPRCVCPPELPVCQCERTPRLRKVTKKPIVPGQEEIGANSRARSARLRVAERV